MSSHPALAIILVLALAPTLAPLTALTEHSVASSYSDIEEAGRHRAAVEALEAAGLFSGTECRTGDFCPNDPLPRWVMAVWMVRAVEEGEPPEVDSTVFSDVDGDVWWARYVQRLSELGITHGCATNPAQFCPDEEVTREQMASFLSRAFGLISSYELRGEYLVRFADVDGSSHALSIQVLAASGITVGCAANPLRYCPGRSVTRAEMATFLARALRLAPIVAPFAEYVEDPDGEGFLHLVSQYTTYHSCCAPRVTNIHLFADKVDGAVVRPGERFSLNGHVGQRTTEKGFVGAGTLLNGEVVNTVGGGVSQFATTFYNAVFWGGYQDVWHNPHSRYFSRYPEGIEATINWPDLDLIFRNDSSRNVLIRTEYTDTSLTVKLFGDNDGRVVTGWWRNGEGGTEVVVEGGDQARVVTAEVSRRLKLTSPPSPTYRSNPKLGVDQRKYLQPAAHGWTLRVGRTIERGGEQSVEWWAVRYLPMRAIIEVHPCVLIQSCPVSH